MSKRMWTDRSAVYVVRSEEDFVPQSPWNFPKAFTGGTLQSANLPLEDARAMVRGLNKANMQRRDENPAAWDHAWAIVVACPRNKFPDGLIRVVSANLAPKARVSA